MCLPMPPSWPEAPTLHIFKGFELYCNNRHLTHSEFDQVAIHREIVSCLTLSNFSIDYVEIPSRQNL